MSEVDLANAVRWASFWERIENWAFFAVVVALAIEFAALKFGAPHKEMIDHSREERISVANERAASAELALAKYRAQRALSPEAQKQVANTLRSFAGTIFDAGIPVGDTECSRLLDTLEEALHAAGFVQIAWATNIPGATVLRRHGKPVVGGVAAMGVVLEVDSKAHPELMAPAHAIAEAFTNGGVPAFVFPEVKTTATNRHAIHLLVGQKT